MLVLLFTRYQTASGGVFERQWRQSFSRVLISFGELLKPSPLY
jgi:hypothetical protein